MPRRLVGGLATLVAACSLTAGTAMATDWSQFGFSSEHRGFNRFETIIGPSNVASLAESWSAGDGGEQVVRFAYAPAVARGSVYLFRHTGVLSARDLDDGDLQWSAALGGGHTPAVAGNFLYAISGTGLAKVNASTGGVVWNRPQGNNVLASPVVKGGRVFLSIQDNIDTGDGEIERTALRAIDAATGARLWTVHSLHFEPGAPTVAGSTVFWNDGSRVRAFDAATGDQLWARSVGAGGSTTGSPIWASGRVHVLCNCVDGTNAVKAQAFDAATGERRWSVTLATGTGIDGHVFAEAAGRLFVGVRDSLTALRSSTGVRLWTTPTIDPVENGVATLANSPVVANGVLYLNGFAHDVTDGDLLAQHPLLGRLRGGTVVVDGRLVRTTNAGVGVLALP